MSSILTALDVTQEWSEHVFGMGETRKVYTVLSEKVFWKAEKIAR
jgi:hypothetical protein